MVSIDGEGRRTLAPPSAAHSPALGQRMHALVERPYPLCRSITGDGVRATLGVLAESILLTVHEIPTGTQVLDWTVPKEWNIRDANVADATGRRVIDFTKSNLRVVSVPIRTRTSLAALREHPHTLPDQPDLVPLGGRSDTKEAQLAMLWVLNLSDGEHSLVQIAERSACRSMHLRLPRTPCTVRAY